MKAALLALALGGCATVCPAPAPPIVVQSAPSTTNPGIPAMGSTARCPTGVPNTVPSASHSRTQPSSISSSA